MTPEPILCARCGVAKGVPHMARGCHRFEEPAPAALKALTTVLDKLLRRIP